MKKTISILLLLSMAVLYACKDMTPNPEPEPDEYFSFYADGEYFNYSQKKVIL